MKSSTTTTKPEYFATQACELDAFSLTPRFTGVGVLVGLRNRFNGFSLCVETAETVSGLCPVANTSLKRGVNGRSGGAKYRRRTPPQGVSGTGKPSSLLWSVAVCDRQINKQKTNNEK
jgi:hypothetical protein